MDYFRKILISLLWKIYIAKKNSIAFFFSHIMFLIIFPKLMPLEIY